MRPPRRAPARGARRVAACALVPAVALVAQATPAPPVATPPAAAPSLAGLWRGSIPGALGEMRVVLVVREGGAARFVVVEQPPASRDLRLVTRGDSIVAEAADGSLRWAGTRDTSGQRLDGRLTRGATVVALPLRRAASGDTTIFPRRPQDPMPPFPYRTRELSAPSVPGVRLAGTLTLPAGRGPFAAVVLVSGSGPQDRDEGLMNHRPFAVLADFLARRGIASYRYDDRGTAQSTGRFEGATTADFAADAAAAVQVLRDSVPEVDAARIGIVGHSEGGVIAPWVAARDPRVAFVVLLAGPGLRGDSLLLLQNRALFAQMGASGAALDAAVAQQRELYAAVTGARDSADAARRLDTVYARRLAGVAAAGRAMADRQVAGAKRQLLDPWIRWFLRHDPAPDLRALRVPVLALNGALDLQVTPAENLAAIATAVRAGGRASVDTVTFPRLNHLFQTATTGAPAEYARIDETMAPAVLERIATWIAAVPRRR